MAVAFTDGNPTDLATTHDGQVWVVGKRQTKCATPNPGSTISDSIISGGHNTTSGADNTISDADNTISDADNTISGAVWHYNGREWRSLPAPDCATELTRVLTTTAGAVWVLGEGSKTGCSARWNGTTWTDESTLTSDTVLAAFGTDGLWLRKGTALVRRSGRSTRKYELGMTPQTVSVLGPNKAWAVGFRRPADKEAEQYTAAENVPHFARWNGRVWDPIPSPELDLPKDARRSWLFLTDQFASAPDDVWAVGRVGSKIPPPACTPMEDETCVQARLLILHWNGTTWSQHLGKPVAWDISGRIAPDGTGGFWLPEADGNKLAHLSHGRLTPVHLPGDFTRLTAIATQPGTTHTWLLGWSGAAPPNWILWSTK
ncbi:hypothetical protein HII36_14000 [Nonomuraea sp. NN258]|uniref:hypothetical protein n=1 Tax=Nonomuraea antri TaxID=2730852 RepID=UPI001569B174|nr:hypothetical protein [Nonomuraea antri]NRQ32947.1 hypothetical protein [Nonomuraea antri]